MQKQSCTVSRDLKENTRYLILDGDLLFFSSLENSGIDDQITDSEDV